MGWIYLPSLFNRVCQVNISGRVFEYPPFSIEFEKTARVGTLSTTTVRLFNPSEATVQLVEGKRTGTATIFPLISIVAGYKELFGAVVTGEITGSEVKKQGVDRILEIKVCDKTFIWANAIVNKSFRNVTGTAAINAAMTAVGITGTVRLGVDRTYRSITLTTFRDAVQQICRDTQSEFFFSDGVLTIQPALINTPKNIIKLSADSGLLGSPQKTGTGFRFTTLFLYNVSAGAWAQLDAENIKQTVKITQSKHKFSSFGQTSCEYEATAA